MENEERLERIATQEENWRTAALAALYERDMTTDGHVVTFEDELQRQVAEQAEVLRRQTADGGELAVQALRDHVTRANALDREAVERYGADLSRGEDVWERTARRIMHLAGRTVLKEINREKQRQTNGNIARNARRGHQRRRKYMVG